MIQQKTTYIRPSADVPWHWNVVNRQTHAQNLDKNYFSTGKVLTQYEEAPNELTSTWYRFWDSQASIDAYFADPEVIEWDTAAKSYNDFAGIVVSPHDITTIN